MKHNIQHQMAKYLTVTMLLSSMFVVIVMLTSMGTNALVLLQSNQLAVVRGLQDLYDRTGIPASELMATYPQTNHTTMLLPEDAVSELEPVILDRLNGGETISDILLSTSMVKIGNEVILITSYPLRNRLIRALTWSALILCVFFASGMLLSSFGSKRFTGSIVRLTRATRSVADGDFSVQVRETANAPIEVQILTHNFNTMVRELNKNISLKNDFISAVSHEFKTPLAAIKGYATYASDPSLSDEQRAECLHIVLEETDALTTMTSNILKLSKLENQEIPEKRVEFMLDEQLRQCILALEPGWSEKDLELDIDLPEMRYVGDDELLRQVWVNLLQNAIKFSNPGGTLGVKLYSAPGSVHVAISDTGIGMTPEVASRVFDKFYQADRAHHAQGNGLGLSLVQQILKIVGGHIDLKTAPEQGSTFTVILPITAPVRPEPKPHRPEAIPAHTGRKNAE